MDRIKSYCDGDGLFGATDPEAEGLDVEASIDRYIDQELKALRADFPKADIEIEYMDNAPQWEHTFNGEHDCPEADRISEIASDVFNAQDWYVYK